MDHEIFYLSSMESEAFASTRRCVFLTSLEFGTGKKCVLAELDPPAIGQQFGGGQDIKYVVLASRHEVHSLVPIREFPCFVFICRPLIGDIGDTKIISENDVEVLAWGELYRTHSDADNHVFE